MPSYVADHRAMKAALVQATRAACGLGQNQVVMQDSGDVVAQRPLRPFAALRIQSPAIVSGRGFSRHAGLNGDGLGVFDYYQQMSMVVAWDFFADSQDEAYGMAGALQFGMEVPAIYEPLKAAGLAVWTVNSVTDVTTLLNTGYEARAHLTVQLGYMAARQFDTGIIGTVVVDGQINDGLTTAQRLALRADI